MDEKNEDSIGYAFKGKIMISSITILFFACFAIVAFHVCRRRRSDHRLRPVPSPPPPASWGVDPSAVSSLPTFLYKSEIQESPPECAVCLSEFEEGETGRILPECKHCFHVDCIDAWLRSHRQCPICRTRVTGQPVGSPPNCSVVSIRVEEGLVHESASGLSPDVDGSLGRTLDQDPGGSIMVVK